MFGWCSFSDGTLSLNPGSSLLHPPRASPLDPEAIEDSVLQSWQQPAAPARGFAPWIPTRGVAPWTPLYFFLSFFGSIFVYQAMFFWNLFWQFFFQFLVFVLGFVRTWSKSKSAFKFFWRVYGKIER